MLQNKETLEKEIIRMLSLSNFGTKKYQKLDEKALEKTLKKILKEDFIDDLSDIFGSDDGANKFFTTGPKAILTIEMKAAMLAHSFSQYQAELLGIYVHYNPYTKGASTKDNNRTLFDKDPVQKVKGAAQDFADLSKYDKEPEGHKKGANYEKEWKEMIKSFRVPATFIGTEVDSKSMTDKEKGYIEKWWNNKSYSMISATETGLTELGKAQLEFLARAYTQKPIDDKEKLLFNIAGDGGNNYSEVAEYIIRDFYTLVMIPYIMNLTKRAKFNAKDFQLKVFIENGINHALDQLPDHYDPQRGNLGSFIITVVKNHVINQLKEISEYKLDTGYVYDYLSHATGPITIQSIANPNEVSGNYNAVKPIKNASVVNGKNVNAIYGYVYNNPLDALEDLTNDGRSGKPSPLAKHYLAGMSKSLFYKSFPPNYKDVADQMNLKDINPFEEYNIFKVNVLPGDAKAAVVGVLDKIFETITSDYQTYGVKNINSFMKRHKDFIIKLMYQLLNYGSFIEVYTKTWVVSNENGGITKIAPFQPVKLITTKNGQKRYAPNINGFTPGENDTTWIWSSGQKGEEEIKQTFLNNFIAKVSKEATPGSPKPVPQEFTANGQDIVNKLFGAIRFYFGYNGKTSETTKQNRDQLDILLKNYSNSLMADGVLSENIPSITDVFKKIINS